MSNWHGEARYNGHFSINSKKNSKTDGATTEAKKDDNTKIKLAQFQLNGIEPAFLFDFQENL
ncbi:hypothetical protein LS684_17155 [Cytobacillus spongiae]|uniref:hypothetical protein n=1 Tax=Cytobacillus spongiae TaxID=2901381 RepID=UPI001F3E41D0|nr:hypothetical protein [Cytobacillus spongiae]UII55341.1 hypothetical protein LS684_17155 [Cytobacillus spongiae]